MSNNTYTESEQANSSPLYAGGPSPGRNQSLPIAFRILRALVSTLGHLSPRLTARLLYRIWFSTQRYSEPGREIKWRQQAEQIDIENNNQTLAVYSWGQGPAVLLVHGWNGRGTQLGAFAAPLVKAGYRVLAFDAPAHGRSQGKSTNIFLITEAMKNIAQQFGPIHATISHSFGSMITTYALANGFNSDKVVCFSPPATTEFIIDSFCHALKVPPRAKAAFIDKLDQRFSHSTRQKISPDLIVPNLSIPALIIHDKDDKEVPWQQGEQLVNVWPGARFELTNGLGHRRILRSEQIIRNVIEFITEKHETTN